MSISSLVDPATMLPAELKEMDCITCHNRITHLVYHPRRHGRPVNGPGQISPAIPEIRRKAVEVYENSIRPMEQPKALRGIGGSTRSTIPTSMPEQSNRFKVAIRGLQSAYGEASTQNRTQTGLRTPTTSGTKSPGCFRCHDGKHLNEEQKAIRLECNLCHSIPVVSARMTLSQTSRSAVAQSRSASEP